MKTSGRSRIPCPPLSAGAALAVCQIFRSNPVYQALVQHQGSEQAGPEGQAFRQPPRNFHQTNNRGARPAQLSSPARAGRRLPCLSWNRFRNLSYLSKPARTCRFCAQRFFLLDRPLRSRWRLCRLRMRRTPCGCGPFVSGLSAAAHAAVGLRHAPAGAVFLSRTKREWGVDCQASILAHAPVPSDASPLPLCRKFPPEML